MSVEILYFQGHRIIHTDLEGVTDHDEQLRHVSMVSRIAEDADSPILLLVNVGDFLPGKDYMEFASKESEAHKGQVGKSAYYNVSDKNRVLFSIFNRYNKGVRNRRTFRNKGDALRWLVADPPQA